MAAKRADARFVSSPDARRSGRGIGFDDVVRMRAFYREVLTARAIDAAMAAVEQVRAANRVGVSVEDAHWFVWSAQVSLERATRYVHRLVGESPTQTVGRGRSE